MKKVFKIFEHMQDLTDNHDLLEGAQFTLDRSITSVIKIEQSGNFKNEVEALKEIELRLSHEPHRIFSIEPMWVSKVKYDDPFIF